MEDIIRDLIHEVTGLLPEPIVISIKEQLRITEDLDWEVDTAALSAMVLVFMPMSKSKAMTETSWKSYAATRLAHQLPWSGCPKPGTERSSIG